MRYNQMKSFIIFVIIMSACKVPAANGPAKITLTFGYDSNQTREYLTVAVNAINAVAGCDTLLIDNSWAPRQVIVSYEEYNEKSTHLGVYRSDDTIAYTLLPFIDTEQVYYVLIHEIGHSLGVNHSPNPTSVMYPNANYQIDPFHAAQSMLEAWQEVNVGLDICDTPKPQPGHDFFKKDLEDLSEK